MGYELNQSYFAPVGSALVPKPVIANRYSVTVRTIDNWMHRGVIPYQKIGGVVRFDVSKVDAALARFEVK